MITQGEWGIRLVRGSNRCEYNLYHDNFNTIATIEFEKAKNAASKAALIAAAPKLLAALKVIKKMPCISELLGEAPDPDDMFGGCGCARCVAKAAIEAAGAE